MASWSNTDSANPPTRKKNSTLFKARLLRRFFRCSTIPLITGSNNFFIAMDPKQKYSFLTNLTSSTAQELANRSARSCPPYSETSEVNVRESRILAFSPSEAPRPLYFISNSFISSSHSPGNFARNISTTLVPKNFLSRDTNSWSTFVPPCGPHVTWWTSYCHLSGFHEL